MYIQKDIDGFYFEPEEELQTWFTYEDFQNGKPIKLSDDQIKYHNDHPEKDIKDVMNVYYYDGETTKYYVYDTPQTVEEAKLWKLSEVDWYDSSDAVNDFIINDTIHWWFTAEERTSYRNSIDSAKLVGVSELSFFVGDNLFTVSVEDAERMLAMIQLYADQCFIATKQHKININALQTIEDVQAYDYTVGYPTKLNFTI